MKLLPQITLSPLLKVQVPAFRSLLIALARYEKLEHELLATEMDLDELFFGDSANMYGLLAYRGGEAVGMASYYFNASTFVGKRGLYIEDLFVLPEHRRNGVGTALFHRLKEIAEEEDCARVEWRALDWNDTALDFYQQMGADILRQWLLIRLDALTEVSA